MPEPIFVLDANVFIQAKNSYYAFDLAPAFWESLVGLATQKRVCSIDRVKRELEKGNDELASWAKGAFALAFAPTDGFNIQNSYSDIINWVSTQPQFNDAAKREFANVADGWLVAFGRAQAYIVVTQEVYDPNVRRKVPIPNVCEAFNIEYANTFEMLRRLGVQFAKK